MVRAAVLVSGGGTNLQALIDARGSVLQTVELALVVSSNPAAYALERAKQAGIPAVTIQDEQGLSKVLRDLSIDMIILAGYLKILSPEFTSLWPHRIINVHPALIPAFCGKGMYGLRVHRAALDYGVKLTGATVHYVNAIPDGGQIIAQKAVEVLEGDTPETLQRRVMEQAEWVLLPQAAEKVAKEIEHERLA